VKCESISHGKPYMTEYILNEDDFSLGLTYEKNNRLFFIITEIYNKGRITQYFQVKTDTTNNYSAICEQFHYSDQGLLETARQYFYDEIAADYTACLPQRAIGPFYDKVEKGLVGIIRGWEYAGFHFSANMLCSYTSKKILSADDSAHLTVLKKPVANSNAPARVLWT